MTNQVLRQRVQADLTKRYSPEEIVGRLRKDFPDQPEMWVSTETIYQSLYVQSRGALRRELTKCLRTGRAMRVPNRQGTHRKNRVPLLVSLGGLRLVERFGAWSGQPFAADSPFQLCSCESA